MNAYTSQGSLGHRNRPADTVLKFDQDQLAFAFRQEEFQRRATQLDDYSKNRPLSASYDVSGVRVNNQFSLEDAETKQTMPRYRNSVFHAPIPFRRAPFLRQPVGSFFAIQEWEGYVSDLTDKSLKADLRDLVIGETRPSLTVEIPLEEIPDADLESIRIGGVFRWSIGYYRSRSGQKDRVSRILFRHLPRWTVAEIAAAQREANELATFFSEKTNNAGPKE